jgi:uncharacterized RDD family membrane protein YckC
VPQNAEAPEVVPDMPALSALPPRPAFAGFWLRVSAGLIDCVILWIVFVFFGTLLFRSAFEKMVPPSPPSLSNMPLPSPTLVAIFGVFVCLYFTAFEASGWQATPGKRILKLYVTDLNGKRITFGRALIRNLIWQISGLLLIGYILIGFTEKKQALHDIIASCLVLRRP